MAYTLEEFSTDIRSALQADPGADGQRNVCTYVSKALMDDDFVAKHLTGEQCRPRKVLYEDPDLGFCICGHVYEKAIDNAWPHDHGTAWAIYGLAQGGTDMTDWDVAQEGTGDEPTLVTPRKTYTLNRGDCHLYEVGDIHSPIISAGTKLVRIEGKNLDNVKRSNIKAA